MSGEPCQWALTERRTLRGGGAPKRGQGATLESLAELYDALGGIGTHDIAFIIYPDAAELVAIQAAKGRWRVNGR